MPYIGIKLFPKDKGTKEVVVKKINDIFLEVWSCPQEIITISIEDVAPVDWNERVAKHKDMVQ